MAFLREVKLFLRGPLVVALLVIAFGYPALVNSWGEGSPPLSITLQYGVPYLAIGFWSLFLLTCSVQFVSKNIPALLTIIVVSIGSAVLGVLTYRFTLDGTISLRSLTFLYQYLPVGLACTGLFYYVRLDRVTEQERIEQATREERKQRELTEMQLRLMQAQIEPHFLFNSLSHLHVLIEEDASAAQKFLENIMLYLRGAVPQVRKHSVKLNDDLALVQSYLDIQKSRFENRMTYKIIVDGASGLEYIPSFMLLTLVENAIIHGIEPSAKGGAIVVVVTLSGQKLVIRVSNSGKPLSSDWKEGVGVHNMRERLITLYGDQAELNLEMLSDGKTRATLVVPLASVAL